MTRRALHFRADALRAVQAVTAAHPSTARGVRAKRLSLAAFRDYVVVGRQWALSGQARLRGQKLVAVRHARAATRLARSGGGLLLEARRLLR